MPGHGSNQKNFTRLCLASGDIEVDEVAERALDHRLDVDQMISTVITCYVVNAPIRFDHHPFKRPFGNFTPSSHPSHRRVRYHRERRVRCHRFCRSAKPLVRVSNSLHKIVGRHVTHLRLLLLRSTTDSAFVLCKHAGRA